MTFYHVVSFRTKTPEGLAQLTEGFLKLPGQCLHPTTNKTYISAAKGGKQISTEGIDRGMQVTFIMEFETKADLAYYLDEDPVHDQFKKKVGAEYGVEEVVALDFNEGAY
ncbi:hypothetical protein CI109_105266 [Kwoniella shandongensis]|uniref:Uncharacterized protein n=1 Tax=Kwoniella shandongensis TaxID=1734106 RepID=A0A5M6C3Z0_9TREE|nr:uncharacterized protein CI109_002109 [Kwoniella shandongensis]KAA5529683.1 hypothetical protein CI109_002109 [Kwoniella shandongensis]